MEQETGIMKGAESFFFPAGDTGCLLIHGFAGSPQSLKKMGRHLAREGITTLGVRLKGHGTRVEEMHDCSYQDWIDSAVEGLIHLRSRCRQIFAAGLSMGGALSLHLAHLYPMEIKGLVTICTPYAPRNWVIGMFRVLKRVVKILPVGWRCVKDPDVEEVNYSYQSVPALHELLRLLEVVKEDLPRICQPALVIASRRDPLVRAGHTAMLFNRLGSTDKQVFWVERSSHVATLDYDRELIFQRAAEFIKKRQG